MKLPVDDVSALFPPIRELILRGDPASLSEALRQFDELQSRTSTLVASLFAALGILKRRINTLSKKVFGSTSERNAPGQTTLFDADSSEPKPDPEDLKKDATRFGVDQEQVAAEKAEKRIPANPRKRPKHRGRRPFPASLPRREETLVPAADDLVCPCGKHKIQCGFVSTELLDIIPLQIIIHVLKRPILACTDCDKRETTEVPAALQPLSDVKVGPELLADIIADKYDHHLPLNRQAERFRRLGWEISRSTLWDWLQSAEASLRRVAEAILDEVLASPVIQLDYTHLDVRIPVPKGQVRTRDGPAIDVHYSYAYTGPPGAVFFECVPDKGRTWPFRRLEGYHGYVQCDADSAFNELFKSGDRIECSCWAHVRRKFFEIKDSDERALMALASIRKLYDIERRCRTLAPAERQAVRDRESRPIVVKFFEALKLIAATLPHKAPIRAAVDYALNQEAALRVFLDTGEVEIDNNRCERCHKLTALGRKNWLFAGSAAGAKAHSTFTTLIMSARELDLNVREYLVHLLKVLPGLPLSQVKEHTPRAYAARLKGEAS